MNNSWNSFGGGGGDLESELYLEWIQGPFTVEPLKKFGADIQRNGSHLLLTIRVTAHKSEIQAKNQRYSRMAPPDRNQIAQKRRPNGVSVFLQKRALKPLWIQLNYITVTLHISTSLSLSLLSSLSLYCLLSLVFCLLSSLSCPLSLLSCLSCLLSLSYFLSLSYIYIHVYIFSLFFACALSLSIALFPSLFKAIPDQKVATVEVDTFPCSMLVTPVLCS